MRFLIIALTLLTQPSYASTGKVSFDVGAIGDTVTITGENGTVTGDLKDEAGKLSGTFQVNTGAFTTGIKLRDGHLKEDLDAEKFPVATYTLAPSATSAGKFPISGEMELHGVKKNVAGEATYANGTLKATLVIKLADFGVKRRTHLGIGVGETAKVSVEINK